MGAQRRGSGHKMPQAVILLGSNSEPQRHLPKAVLALRNSNALRLEATSYVLETPAVTESGEPDLEAAPYHNMAALVETSLGPAQLRSELRDLEQMLGRRRSTDRDAEVVIDLDLAVYDDWVWSQDGLTIPDPAIERHAYAAILVGEAVPDWIHPVLGKKYADIAIKLSARMHDTRRSR